jgi:hypothetical protein
MRSALFGHQAPQSSDDIEPLDGAAEEVIEATAQ